MKCPCCRQELKASDQPATLYPAQGIVLRGDKFVQLSQSEMTIVETVFESKADGASVDKLIDALYAHRPDGGPVCARNTVFVLVGFANKRLAKLHVKIAGAGRGRSFSNYHFIEGSAR